MTATNDRFAMLPHLSGRFTKVARQSGFKAAKREDIGRWRSKLRKQLKTLIGHDSMQSAPLKAKVTETVKCDGYTRQRVEIDTEPGVRMPLYVLVPDGIAKGERRPAVLCPHGHDSGGKLCPAGVGDLPEIAQRIKSYDYDYGVQYVKQGLMAMCPDARGFGERQEPSLHLYGKQPITASSCHLINQMANPLGQTVTGMWAWDLHRLVDYVQSRSDCDPKRIGCAGLSGGGLQTIWAVALDDRIKAAVVSGYFYGYRESLLEKHHNCSCNYVPHLYEHVDMGDLGALIAPRPLLIETGTRDPLNGKSGLKNVKSQVAISRKAYKLLDASSSLVHDVFEGEHKWHGKKAVPWLVKQLSA